MGPGRRLRIPDAVRAFPPDVPAVSIEAGVAQGWAPLTDASLSIERFGASAPGTTVLEKLGMTAENVAEHAAALLERVA
jgi:transketolase